MFSSLCSFIKILFVSEPKGSTEELEPVLKGYYDTILGKASVKKGRGGAKQFVKNRVIKNSTKESTKAGAALLAVCRGKVLLFTVHICTVNEFMHMSKTFKFLNSSCDYSSYH
jgi:hypothetical protein